MMSGPSTPNGTPLPKQMSSRLMTMKFMQRAAAANSESHTPMSEPPSKRRRVEPSSAASTPSRTSDSDLNATPQLRKATQTSSRTQHTREGNETEWVLSFSRPNKSQPRSKGHVQDGDVEDDIWGNIPTGRQTYGSFKRKKDQPATTISTGKDEGELSSVSGSSDSEDEYQRRKPAAKAGPGPPRYPQANSYGSPLTKLPNSKERRKQNRAPNKKKVRKTM